jgi:hypothetical protein
VINHDPAHAALISHQYSIPCSGSIIDYADALRLKLKMAGIHTSADLMNIFEGRTHLESSAVFKMQLNDVDQRGLKTSTVRFLEEETIRHLEHARYNCIRYHRMITEIGPDDEPELFPKANILLHHVVSAVSINQRRHKPNRWVNRITLKLISCDINTIEHLESKLNSDMLNDHIGSHHLPRLHQVTLQGFKLILGTADFRRGRS